MISGARDYALTLACLRHGLSTDHGRGFDLLPADVAAPFEDSLVRRLDAADLRRAFRSVVHLLLAEVQAADPALAGRLRQTLMALAD